MLEMLLMLVDTEEDKKKFSEVYDAYHNLIYHISYEHLNDIEESEDSQQDALLYIAKTFDKIKDRTDPEIKCYICAVARGFAINHFNRNKKYERNLIDIDVAGLKYIDEMDEIEFDIFDKIDIQRAIKKLPPEQANIIELKFVYGLSSQEVGTIYGIKDTYARKKLERAKKALRKIVEAEAEET